MQIEVPTLDGTLSVELEPSKPVILLGPNGAGKSRLGIFIDDLETSGASRRIAAQRSLELPEEVFPEGLDQAMAGLRRDKAEARRKRPSPGSIAYDYEELLTALFAEHHRALEDAHAASEGRARSARPVTLIGRLQGLWSELIPHRRLVFSERRVRTVRQGDGATPFDASEMSDGERLIVYVLGQALLLESGGLLIVDEPELHMSRALLGQLWDLVERERSECSFIYVTHDVEFAASRRGARMYAVLDYSPPTFKEVVVRTRKRIIEEVPPRWTIEALPSGTEVPRDVLVRIVGSRKPILFVEGRAGGLDHLVYKAVYETFTVIPVESCGQVIQLVRSFRGQDNLHWLHCTGLVDRDGRDVDGSGRLEDGLYALPVNEIENLLLMPAVFAQLAAVLSFRGDEAAHQLARLREAVFDLARKDAQRIALKQTSGQIWNASKSMGLKARDPAELTKLYEHMVARTDPDAIYRECRQRYESFLEERDFEAILRVHDNKGGLLDALAKCLHLHGRTELEAFVGRALLREEQTGLVGALRKVLPHIDPMT